MNNHIKALISNGFSVEKGRLHLYKSKSSRKFTLLRFEDNVSNLIDEEEFDDIESAINKFVSESEKINAVG